MRQWAVNTRRRFWGMCKGVMQRPGRRVEGGGAGGRGRSRSRRQDRAGPGSVLLSRRKQADMRGAAPLLFSLLALGAAASRRTPPLITDERRVSRTTGTPSLFNTIVKPPSFVRSSCSIVPSNEHSFPPPPTCYTTNVRCLVIAIICSIVFDVILTSLQTLREVTHFNDGPS